VIAMSWIAAPSRCICRALACLLCAAGLAAPAFAQNEGGQFWVRLYDDLNADGMRGDGEPLVTEGVVVNLLNAENVVVFSTLLDESPNAERGLIGFQSLPPGQYAVEVRSALYSTTTASRLPQIIEADAAPVVVEIGLRPVNSAQFAASPLEEPRGIFGTDLVLGTRAQVSRTAISLMGAMIVVAGMSVLGVFTYMLVARPLLRARLRRELLAGLPTAVPPENRTTDPNRRYAPPTRVRTPAGDP
jgi:hypothetical protein